jgi:hypothetical protein
MPRDAFAHHWRSRSRSHHLLAGEPLSAKALRLGKKRRINFKPLVQKVLRLLEDSVAAKVAGPEDPLSIITCSQLAAGASNIKFEEVTLHPRITV